MLLSESGVRQCVRLFTLLKTFIALPDRRHVRVIILELALKYSRKSCKSQMRDNELFNQSVIVSFQRVVCPTGKESLFFVRCSP